MGLPDFFKYNLWTNLRLLDTCSHLSDAQLDATMRGSFGSVRETIMHLCASEEGYAGALTGKSPTPRLKEFTTFPSFDELRLRDIHFAEPTGYRAARPRWIVV